MKWFGDTPAIRYSDFHTLTGARKGVVKDWEYVELVGEFWDDSSYHVFRHLPTGKLYRTCWGSIAPDGKMRPSGQYDSEVDYKPLKEVMVVHATNYKDVRGV